MPNFTTKPQVRSMSVRAKVHLQITTRLFSSSPFPLLPFPPLFSLSNPQTSFGNTRQLSYSPHMLSPIAYLLSPLLLVRANSSSPSVNNFASSSGGTMETVVGGSWEYSVVDGCACELPAPCHRHVLTVPLRSHGLLLFSIAP
jgi:hypothetical protein